MTEYQVGELVDIAIKGALVELMPAADPDTSWLTVTVGVAGHSLDLPLAVPAVTVTRVAPKEWQTLQAGDIWTDTVGDEWAARESEPGEGVTRMVCLAEDCSLPPDEFVQRYRVTLVRRRDWTPAPEPVVPERDKEPGRASVGYVLRVLADYLDAGQPMPSAPLHIRSDEIVFQHHHEDRAGVDRWAALLDLPEPSQSGPVYDEGTARPWQNYGSEGTWQGWPVSVWCSAAVTAPEPVDEPAPEPHGAEVPAESTEATS